MADRHLGLQRGGAGYTKIRRLLAAALPEWQVFVRRQDGSSDYFTLTRRRQSVLLAGVAVVAVWAVGATALLTHQPELLDAKERRMEEQMASYRAGQERLASTQKLVGQITKELDGVHANLVALAETNASLARDRAVPPGAVITPARPHVAAEPAYDDDGQPGSRESKAVRDELHKLELSLDRLQTAYTRAVQNTTDKADQHISEGEKAMERLGLDPDHLIASHARAKGRGGPFVPAHGFAGGDDGGLAAMLARMERWDGVKGTLKNLPLGEPLHTEWEVNSPFGVRNDPLNARTGIHEGVDLGAPYGTPIYATGNGTVKMAGPYDRYGLTVDIDHGNGFSTRYAHLSKIRVQAGQKVTRSTVIGLLGNSGRSTGAHLHYEVRVADSPRNPLKFIAVGQDAPKIR